MAERIEPKKTNLSFREQLTSSKTELTNLEKELISINAQLSDLRSADDEKDIEWKSQDASAEAEFLHLSEARRQIALLIHEQSELERKILGLKSEILILEKHL